MATSDRRADLRRYPRAKVTWPVILELENRSLQLETVNLSPMGTKVRVDEPLEVGKTAKLHFRPPNGRSLDVDAIVWRARDVLAPVGCHRNCRLRRLHVPRSLHER